MGIATLLLHALGAQWAVADRRRHRHIAAAATTVRLRVLWRLPLLAMVAGAHRVSPFARVPSAAGFKKLVKDANLELKVYDMEQMSRLFMQKGGAKGIGSSQDETLSLGVEQFITLMVHLAFGRDNPRYVAAKESKKEETVPVLQCVQKESLPPQLED